jgi:AAA15 family ATPase/GTPase
MTNSYKSETRESLVIELLEKVRKQNYMKYLVAVRLEKIRSFRGAEVNFNFPVTALIGPNGGGKSTILGATSLIFDSIAPRNIFRKSRIGDDDMDDWKIEYEAIDKEINPKGTIRSEVIFKNNSWQKTNSFSRNVKIFGITRTLPPTENPLFMFKKKLTVKNPPDKEESTYSTKLIGGIDQIKREAERILGKSLSDFQLLEVTYTTIKRHIQNHETTKKTLEDGTIVTTRRKIEPIDKGSTVRESKQLTYLGSIGGTHYSEFNFGAGEASVIRMVADIEVLPDNSLVLIEEIENGLHPLAVCRMVDYFIDVARRKNIQVVFTTHSDYALVPLPPEAIWASIDGKLQQGKLSVEALRAISGRIDKKLAIFVEDDFTKYWIEAILREKLSDNLEEIGVYPVFGDGNAIKIHQGHSANPAVSFHSICFIDGDSRQKEDDTGRIYRLPGDMPETTVFNNILNNLESNIALLTAACQRPLEKQGEVAEEIRKVSRANRDPHLLFSQTGMKLGFISEAIIRGAFLAIWIQQNPDSVNYVVEPVKQALSLPAKK